VDANDATLSENYQETITVVSTLQSQTFTIVVPPGGMITTQQLQQSSGAGPFTFPPNVLTSSNFYPAAGNPPTEPSSTPLSLTSDGVLSGNAPYVECNDPSTTSVNNGGSTVTDGITTTGAYTVTTTCETVNVIYDVPVEDSAGQTVTDYVDLQEQPQLSVEFNSFDEPITTIEPFEYFPQPIEIIDGAMNGVSGGYVNSAGAYAYAVATQRDDNNGDPNNDGLPCEMDGCAYGEVSLDSSVFGALANSGIGSHLYALTWKFTMTVTSAAPSGGSAFSVSVTSDAYELATKSSDN
jgi:hypothetical protein